MDHSSLTAGADELLDIVITFMLSRKNIMAVLPADMARAQERLDNARLSGGTKRLSAENDRFYRIGMVMLYRYKKPISMGELSKSLGVPLSNATRIVDGLVDSGLAERVADPDDRRVVRVTLSTEGRELYETMNAYVRQRIEQVLSTFTAEEREQFIHLLRKALNTLTDSEESQPESARKRAT